MTDKDFKSFIDDNSWELNRKTIEQMMEKELEKEPEDINTEFVDCCMNYLTGYSKEETLNKKGKVIKEKHTKRIKFSRIIIAAVIVILSASVGMTAYAKVNDLQIKDVLVSIFDNKAVVKYSEKKLIDRYSNNLNGNPLYNDLEENGIENIMLPFDLYYTDYKLISNNFDAADRTLVIAFENNIVVKISDYEKENNIQNLDIEGTFLSSKKININNIDIYLFERQIVDGVETLISYQIEKTQYLIVIKEDIMTAEKFVLKNRF